MMVRKTSLGVDAVLFELLLLQVFSAPGDVGGLALLLKLPNLVVAEAHHLEVFSVLGDESLGLLDRALLVGLHGQEHEVSFLGLRMCGQMHEGLSQEFRIFPVAGDDEGIVFLLGGRSEFQLFGLPQHGALVALILLSVLGRGLPVLELLGLGEEAVGLVDGGAVPDDGLQALEGDEGEGAEAVHFVGCGEEEGAGEHQCPVDHVEHGQEELVFVDVIVVPDVHF